MIVLILKYIHAYIHICSDIYNLFKPNGTAATTTTISFAAASLTDWLNWLFCCLQFTLLLSQLSAENPNHRKETNCLVYHLSLRYLVYSKSRRRSHCLSNEIYGPQSVLNWMAGTKLNWKVKKKKQKQNKKKKCLFFKYRIKKLNFCSFFLFFKNKFIITKSNSRHKLHNIVFNYRADFYLNNF